MPVSGRYIRAYAAGDAADLRHRRTSENTFYRFGHFRYGSIMADKRSAAIGASAVAVLIGGAMAWAGSRESATLGGVPVFAIAVALAFLVQWVVFIPSYLMRTEHYHDLTGSLTYISVMLFAVLANERADARSFLLLALVLVWAGRLGAFLFRRVLRAGKCGRGRAIFVGMHSVSLRNL